MEKTLRDSNEYLRTTLNSIGDAVIATDADGLVTGMNPVAENLTGWFEDEARGRPLTDIFKIYQAGTMEPAGNPVHRVKQTGEVVSLANHTLLISKNGENYHIADSAAPIRGAYGAIIGAVLVFRDVTEEHKRREELRRERDRLDHILNITGTRIDIVDGEFNLHFVDKGWQKVYGDSVGRKCYDYFKGLSEPCPDCGISRALRDKEVVVTEEVLPRENNRIVEVHIIPFQNGEGRWLVAEFNVDITERKRAENVNRLLFDISNAVVTAQSLDDLYRSIHAALGRVMDVTNYFIAIVDMQERTLYFPYHVDTEDEDFYPITDFNPAVSLTGLVVSERQPVLYKKEELEKRAQNGRIWGPVPLIWMGTPLMIEDEVIGIVAVQSYTDPDLYSEQDLKVLSAVSDQMAGAIARKKAEEALWENVALLARSQQIAHLGSWKVDVPTNHLEWSDEVYLIIGCEPQEFEATYEAFLSFVHPDDRTAVDEAYTCSVRERHDSYEIEHRIVRKATGEVRFVHERCVHEFDNEGAVIRSIGMVQDITERKHADEAQKISGRIEKACHKEQINDVPLSLATGLAAKVSTDQKLSDLLKEAEDNMYRDKLTESRSGKSAIVSSLLQTLAAKSFETEAHTRNMQEAAKLIGEKLGLPHSELHRLQLLITLHDIGKINIPEELLTRKGPLSGPEWEIMKKHSETGYRVARATESFAHVAEDILAHHERWDGKGYPQGLKEDKIPLLARITAIADAYEVMSHGRPYKKAMHRNEITAEFKNCAGLQFDPQLVKLFLAMLEENSGTNP